MKRETITNDKLNIGRTKMAYVALLIDLYKHEVISKEKAEEILGFKITDYYKDSPYADGGDVPPGPIPPTPTAVATMFAWKYSDGEGNDEYYFTSFEDCEGVETEANAGHKSGDYWSIDNGDPAVIVAATESTLTLQNEYMHGGEDFTVTRCPENDVTFDGPYDPETGTLFYLWNKIEEGHRTNCASAAKNPLTVGTVMYVDPGSSLTNEPIGTIKEVIDATTAVLLLNDSTEETIYLAGV